MGTGRDEEAWRGLGRVDERGGDKVSRQTYILSPL